VPIFRIPRTTHIPLIFAVNFEGQRFSGKPWKTHSFTHTHAHVSKSRGRGGECWEKGDFPPATRTFYFAKRSFNRRILHALTHFLHSFLNSPPIFQTGVTQISLETLANCCQFGKNYSALDFHAHTHTHAHMQAKGMWICKRKWQASIAFPTFSVVTTYWSSYLRVRLLLRYFGDFVA